MTESQKHAARLREVAAVLSTEVEEQKTRASQLENGSQTQFHALAAAARNEALIKDLLAGAEALEAQEVKVTRVMDPDAAAYHARIATHCDRLEAIHERIAKALEIDALSSKLKQYIKALDESTFIGSFQEFCERALEPKAQGRWRVGVRNGQGYMIPVGREDEWQEWCSDAEAGEYTAIVPKWAVAVPDDVVITGWEG